jgi:SAM-dependent methyltransferase
MERLETFADWRQDGWDSFFVQKGRQWRNKDYRYINDLFDLRRLNGSLLDVGCGLGDGLAYLKNKCPEISRLIGTDFSHKAIETCRNNPKLSQMTFFRHDILKPLPEKYDNVICLQTLEHLQDPQTAMQNLVDAAEKVLIVGVPCRNRRPDQNHIWSFTEDDFSELTDSYHLDKKQKNIYWLVDKQQKGIGFYRKSSQSPGKFIAKLFRSLCGNG